MCHSTEVGRYSGATLARCPQSSGSDSRSLPGLALGGSLRPRRRRRGRGMVGDEGCGEPVGNYQGHDRSAPCSLLAGEGLDPMSACPARRALTILASLGDVDRGGRVGRIAVGADRPAYSAVTGAPPTMTFTPGSRRPDRRHDVAHPDHRCREQRADMPTRCAPCSRAASTKLSGVTLVPRSTTSMLAPFHIIPTRFLPMSWRSPLMVPRTALRSGRIPRSGKDRFQQRGGLLHRPGADEHLGHVDLAALEPTRR